MKSGEELPGIMLVIMRDEESSRIGIDRRLGSDTMLCGQSTDRAGFIEEFALNKQQLR